MANMNQQLNCECQLHVGLNYSNHFPINGESCWKNVIPWHSHSLSKFDTNQWHIKGDIIQMFIYMGVSKIWGVPQNGWFIINNGKPQLQWMTWGVSFSHPPGHWPISKVQLQDLSILGFQLLGPLCRLKGSRRSQFHESLAQAPNPGECRLQRLLHHETNLLSYPTPLQRLVWHKRSEGDDNVSNQAQCSSITTGG